MMLGIDVGDGESAGRIVDECFKRGLIIETSGAHGQIVKLLSPLTIEEDELEQGLDILRGALAAVAGKPALVSAA
jgi:diaminobutyrate-2-oxoglutarate transaminase